MKLKATLAALAVIAAAAHFGAGETPPPAPQPAAQAPGLSSELVQALSRQLAVLQESAPRPGEAAAHAFMAMRLDPVAQALQAQFERLRSMAPGEEAVELSRALEAAINPGNTAAYIQALLSTDHPAVERVAISALARTADARTMVELAGFYGSVAPEHRGRILQVLEGSENAAAAPGLISIVDADTSEKRSPIMMSALYGLANAGAGENIEYLLGQLGTENAEYALMALERVRTPQGVEMIRSAAEGSKDTPMLAADFQPALRRIAAAGERP